MYSNEEIEIGDVVRRKTGKILYEVVSITKNGALIVAKVNAKVYYTFATGRFGIVLVRKKGEHDE